MIYEFGMHSFRALLGGRTIVLAGERAALEHESEQQQPIVFDQLQVA